MVKFDTLSIIIPVYNEARTVHQILDLLRELELLNNIRKEIILVNDCSTDASADTIRAYAARYPALGLRLLEHQVARPCTRASARPPATTLSSRMPTSNTTPRSITS